MALDSSHPLPGKAPPFPPLLSELSNPSHSAVQLETAFSVNLKILNSNLDYGNLLIRDTFNEYSSGLSNFMFY